ncbi:protein U55B [macacine betaherpesvirus 9]|uniref:Protein U55B n=1 Tax=macacine betaherpesvirus 9 TaxID=2560568 RepID=A0A191S3T8_9BETA|nr:protein U55B [macacine betaherpesvirus 9]ANC96550.1 protein U55B [macacine betaherpesvirus 9]
MSTEIYQSVKYIQVKIPYKEEYDNKDEVDFILDETLAPRNSPVLLFTTESTSKKCSIIFSAHSLANEQEIKIRFKKTEKNNFPLQVVIFGFPLLKVSSSLLIVPSYDIKDQEQMAILPGLLRFKDQQTIATNNPRDTNELTVTVFNLEWKLSVHQRQLENIAGRPLTTLCTICSVNMNQLPVWFNEIRGNNNWPIGKVIYISDPSISVRKIVFSPPLLDIYLRCYAEMTIHNTFIVPSDCMLKLSFMKKMTPNEIFLTVNMPHFRIINDKRQIDVYFQEIMHFAEEETKRLYFRGYYWTFEAYAVYFPDPDSKVKSNVFFWPPNSTFSIKVSSTLSQTVTTNDKIGSIFFIPKHVLRTRFDSKNEECFKSELDLHPNESDLDALYFLADKILLSDLPDLILKNKKLTPNEKNNKFSSSNHFSSNTRLRF